MKSFLTSVVSSALLFVPLAAEARSGTATVYHPWYSGRTTACGQAYIHWGISAAHPSLPCGTKVNVHHKGRALTVTVNDRCDCFLDLSAGAASRLNIPVNGIGRVKIEY